MLFLALFCLAMCISVICEYHITPTNKLTIIYCSVDTWHWHALDKNTDDWDEIRSE